MLLEEPKLEINILYGDPNPTHSDSSIQVSCTKCQHIGSNLIATAHDDLSGSDLHGEDSADVEESADLKSEIRTGPEEITLTPLHVQKSSLGRTKRNTRCRCRIESNNGSIRSCLIESKIDRLGRNR